MAKIILDNSVTPSAPALGKTSIYVDSADGVVKSINHDAEVTILKSVAGAARVLGPFPFAFDTPNIENGVAFYTPTVDDWIIDVWISVAIGWDGTSPYADVGTFAGGGTARGLWSLITGGQGAHINLGNEDFSYQGDGTLLSSQIISLAAAQAAFYPVTALTVSGAALIPSSASNPLGNLGAAVPARFATTDPLEVVVSQDGTKGGDPVGGAQGSSSIYIVIATPSLI